MTCCIGIKVKDGIIGLSDTRITSGSEYINASKTTIIQRPNHSMFIMTSGLRAARDKALTYFDEVLRTEDIHFSRLYVAVNAFAEQVRRVRTEDLNDLKEGGYNFDLTCIIGGQLEEDKEHKLYMLYPEGNWVESSEDCSYYLIGETAFGKPIIQRTMNYRSSLETALKISFLAFDATRVAARDVDYPIDILLYRVNTFQFTQHRYEAQELLQISTWWESTLERAIKRMPSKWTRLVLG